MGSFQTTKLKWPGGARELSRAVHLAKCWPRGRLPRGQLRTCINIHVPNERRVILLHVSNCKMIFNFLIKSKNYTYKYINPNPTLSVRIYYTIYVHKP